jgi:hypothetical protein
MVISMLPSYREQQKETVRNLCTDDFLLRKKSSVHKTS